jgi:hypothetical protein
MSVRFDRWCLAAGALAWSACTGPASGTRSDGGDVDAAWPNGAPGGDGAADEGNDLDAGVCQPRNVAGFSPPPYPYGRADANSHPCGDYGGDAGLVRAYGDACLGLSRSYGACMAVSVPDSASAAACYDCLITTEESDASPFGVVIGGPFPIINYAACIESLDPTEAGASCARAAYAAASCAEYACKPTCPIHDDVSHAAFEACTNEAILGACSGYYLSAVGCAYAEQGDGDTPVARVCFAETTAEDHYLSIARYFCGAQ